MMVYKRLITMLSVADLRRTLNFYIDALGFELIATFGNPEPVWCHLRHGPVHLMFNAPGEADLAAIPARARDFQIFYFYPEDVATLRSELLGKGLAVSQLRDTIYGMREFELRDPDGYWLWFGQPIGEIARTLGTTDA